MIIVWLSIALVIVALIWLVVSMFKTGKDVKDKVVRCTKSAEILRKGSESILKGNEKLQETSHRIMENIEKKRGDLKYVKDQGEALAVTLDKSKDQLVDAYRTLKNKLEV